MKPNSRSVITVAIVAVVLIIGTMSSASLAHVNQSSVAGGGERLIVSGDIVNSSLGCVLSNKFERGQKVVWRMQAVDANGAMVPDAQLSVQVPGLDTLQMKLGPHGKGANPPQWWTVSWQIPFDAKTGPLNYTVKAVDKAGRTGSFVPFQNQNSLLTVVPARLKTQVDLVDPATGKPFTGAVAAGATIEVQVRATYPQYGERGQKLPPPTPVTDGQGSAVLGWQDDYNALTGKFTHPLATVQLHYDAKAKAWVGLFQAPARTGYLEALATVADNVPDPNTGTALSPAVLVGR
ncbi:MAG: hypothetical protein QJR08_02820 [Bacillota bacterium]|nr:hypothetical protein [Bacillota bacterium]